MLSTHKERPARTYATGPVTRALRYAALGGVGALCVYVALTYSSLPNIVPTHFGFSGEADSWGSKSSVWTLLGINVVMVAGIAGFSTRPRWFNYVSEITEENAQRLYREGERMMVWIGVAIMVLSWGMALSIYDVDNPLMVLGLIALPAITIAGLIRMSLAADSKPAQDEASDSAIKKSDR